MNKFLSILAATGLLAAFAGTAHAAPPASSTSSVTSTVVVRPTCAMVVKSRGSVEGNATLPSKIGTEWGTQPQLETVCNTGGHTITANKPTFTLDGVPAPDNYLVRGGFGGGDGVYRALTTLGTLSENPASFEVTTTTSDGGDKFSLQARIETGLADSSLLRAGTYVATISVTLAP
ncbi:hypothetical protein [Chamaesiphon polymorphus]|uniref:Spore coat protein U domain-containing protein n=1 Tax=Chamaesiphon polymorphus CCALA 037 TaxID=2107692 RepID=A0A2T1GH40_9CYAN|nr:hypothetical protein [Chamaesiphon polymorphus]PSB56917.1 hypothetical protein C7B77_10235 [Chamaesiphon polymorphus CCALA 037]